MVLLKLGQDLIFLFYLLFSSMLWRYHQYCHAHFRVKSLYHKLVTQILNTEVWKKTDESGQTNKEFTENTITVLSEHFAKLLQNDELTTQAAELLNQWHSLLELVYKYLSVTAMPYLICWCHIFTSLKNTWKDILLLTKLLFTILISNANLERMFSMLNQVKTLHHFSAAQLIGKTCPNFRRWTWLQDLWCPSCCKKMAEPKR